MVYAIESIVIDWSHQIYQVLIKNSCQFLFNNLYSTPLIELNFWKTKVENFENIYSQLNTIKIRKMAQILEHANSSYFVPFKEMFKSVITGLFF